MRLAASFGWFRLGKAPQFVLYRVIEPLRAGTRPAVEAKESPGKRPDEAVARVHSEPMLRDLLGNISLILSGLTGELDQKRKPPSVIFLRRLRLGRANPPYLLAGTFFFALAAALRHTQALPQLFLNGGAPRIRETFHDASDESLDCAGRRRRLHGWFEWFFDDLYKRLELGFGHLRVGAIRLAGSPEIRRMNGGERQSAILKRRALKLRAKYRRRIQPNGHQIGTLEARLNHQRAPKIDVRQQRTLQKRIYHKRALQVYLLQHRALKPRLAESCALELGAIEVGVLELRPLNKGALQLSFDKNCVAQLRADEGRSLQSRAVENRSFHMGAVERRSLQLGEQEIGARQVGRAEVRVAEVSSDKTAAAEIAALEIVAALAQVCFPTQRSGRRIDLGQFVVVDHVLASQRQTIEIPRHHGRRNALQMAFDPPPCVFVIRRGGVSRPRRMRFAGEAHELPRKKQPPRPRGEA
jgi:hypothetical protein